MFFKFSELKIFRAKSAICLFTFSLKTVKYKYNPIGGALIGKNNGGRNYRRRAYGGTDAVGRAEKKALLIVSDAKEKAKADRKSIIENAENAAEELLSDARQKAEQLRASAGNEAESALDTLKQSYDKNITAAVNKAVEILKS